MPNRLDALTLCKKRNVILDEGRLFMVCSSTVQVKL